MGEISIGNGGGEDMNQPDVSAENKVRSGQRGEPCRGQWETKLEPEKKHMKVPCICAGLYAFQNILCAQLSK